MYKIAQSFLSLKY